jgi:hypothetical protein
MFPADFNSAIVAGCDNRARFSNGGNYGQRTCGSPTSDQIASGRSIRRRDLWDPEAITRLVQHLVAPVSNAWPQRAVRSDAIQRAASADLTRTRTDQRRNSAKTGLAGNPGTRYNLIGASAILAELQILHIRPLPGVRTVERVLERNGETVPRVQLAPYLARSTYPKPQANHSNQLHQVDAVGPLYLKGNCIVYPHRHPGLFTHIAPHCQIWGYAGIMGSRGGWRWKSSGWWIAAN